jgi:succinate dehydrogenase (ubiquinone) iron-sulfur subunit
MKGISKRDQKKRKDFFNMELRRKLLKYILFNKKLSVHLRWSAHSNFKRLPSNSSIVKVKIRCFLTLRRKSVIKQFRVSRIFFRSFAAFGQLVGVIKKS